MIGKTTCAKWKTMQVKHYDVLKVLFGEDQATGIKSITNKMRHNQLEKEREKDKKRETLI